MTLAQRYEGVLAHFQATMPRPMGELKADGPWQALVAVMLSAQCTDKRINLVTPALFAAYPTPASMATATVDDLLAYIGSVSYPNSKARHLQLTAQMLVSDFGGEVPSTMDELTRLPGVGRKTANVVLGLVFGQATIAVDTHVFRVSRRIGLATGTTPLAVEKTLTRHIPAHQRFNAHHWLLLHGRYTCKAQRPLCDQCAIIQWCKHYQRTSRTTPKA